MSLIYYACIFLIVKVGQSQAGGGGGSNPIFNIFNTYSYSQPCYFFNCGRTWPQIIIGTILGICCVCCIICFPCWRRVLKFFPCHTFAQLKKQYNIVDQNSMTLQQFARRRDYMIQLFRKTKQNNNFSYNQRQKIFRSIVNTIQISSDQQPFISQFKMNGYDVDSGLNQWDTIGYILCKNGRIFMWMYKQYVNRQSAGQIGDYKHLIYQTSYQQNQNGVAGRWFYTGFQNSNLYSGRWYLNY